MAEALYRKYRPQVFEDMVGQEHIERTLKNAIDQDKVSHAYLFCGPRGTGKTTTARLLAKALLCENGPTSSPDGTCRDCEEVAEGTHPDVYELDAASRTGVENVREEIIGRVNFAPTRGKKKIYIIDEVHMLSTAAFNALLKTLEEPPSHVVFVLCTTDPQKVPATIHSRCQRFDFHRLGTDEIVSRLGAVCMGEGVEFEGDALAIVAHRADGGMRNALTSLEQLIAFGNGTVTVRGAEDLLGSLDSSDMAEIVRAVGRRDVAACFNWTANYVESGADLAQFARDLAQRIRNMYVMSLVGADVALEIPDAERREIAEELQLFGPDRLTRILALLGDLIFELRTAGNPRLCFEIALTRMVRPDSDLTLESLAERVEALEAGKSAVAMYVPESASAHAPQSGSVSSRDLPVTIPSAPTSTIRAAADAGFSPAAQAAVAAPVQASAVHVTAQKTQEQAKSRSASSAASGIAPDEGIQVQNSPSLVVPDSQGAQDGQHTAGHAAKQPNSALASIVANPAALQRVWRSVVSAVKKERVSYGVLFVNVRARAEADGSGVVVEFPADNPFAFAMAQKPDVQDVMSKAFDQVAGVHVPFRCAQALAEPTPAAPSAAIPLSQAPSVSAQSDASCAPIGMPSTRESRTSEKQSHPAQARFDREQAEKPQPMVSQSAQTANNMSGVPGDRARRLQMSPAPYDEVPLDVYDGMAPSYEEDFGYDNYAPASGQRNAPDERMGQSKDAAISAQSANRLTTAPQPSAQADSPARLEPSVAFTSAEPVAPVESAGPVEEPAANADDLSKMISGSMGVDVIFEEVDE